MKKTFVTLSLAAITFFGFAASAQQQDQQQAKKVKTECVNGQKCSKGDDSKFNPFEGITLSPEQKAKVKALKQEAKQNAKKDGQKAEGAFKKGEKGVAGEFKKGENAVVGEYKKVEGKFDRKEAAKQRQEANREHLKKMKEILTPEQYQTYLENIAVNSNIQPKKDGKFDKKADKRDGKKDGKKCDRKDRDRK